MGCKLHWFRRLLGPSGVFKGFSVDQVCGQSRLSCRLDMVLEVLSWVAQLKLLLRSKAFLGRESYGISWHIFTHHTSSGIGPENGPLLCQVKIVHEKQNDQDYHD